MPIDTSPWLRRLAASLALSLIGFSAAAQAPPPLTNAPPIPAGEGRVWFYRVFLAEDSGDMPAISINGQVAGYARAGWSFYRDLPAGSYRVSVASYLPDGSKEIVLHPGTQAALSIQSSPYVSGDLSSFRRGVYEVTAEPGGAAYEHIEQTRFGTGY
jgi:hypothetical protein